MNVACRSLRGSPAFPRCIVLHPTILPPAFTLLPNMRFRYPSSLCLLALLATGAAAADQQRAELDFFEKKIRPVLVKHCYRCHGQGEEDPKGGLRLDSRESVRTGGDSGPAVVPGDVDESLIVAALRHEGLEMPPENKLPESVAQDFERWIRGGAVDPRDGSAPQRREIDLQAGRQFWSFRPPVRPAVPAVQNLTWPRTTIDRFVLARLEQADLEPVAPAERRTLVRRLYFDLIGLPPTPEQVEEFVSAKAPGALEQLVDRLLAAPQFGERWGRHWLDLARYADSTGGGRTRSYDNAWRYRDYVIDALNDDKPYDQFIAEQIAGDLLPYETPAQRRAQLIATGYLALGPHNYENQDKELLKMDVVDEQITTLGTSILGMTLGCARCHDHKFDPIATRDYYALAGIFTSTKMITPGNVSGYLERPLPVDEAQQSAIADYQARIKRLETELAEARKKLESLKPSGAVQADALPGIVLDDTQAALAGKWESSTYHPRFLGRSYLHDANRGKGRKAATFAPEIAQAGIYEVRLAYTPGTNRDRRVPVTVRHADGEKVVHVDQSGEPPVDGLFVSLGKFRFEAGRPCEIQISNRDTRAHVIVDGVQLLPPGAAATALANRESKPDAAQAARRKAAVKDQEKRIEQLEKQLSGAKKKAPPQPVAMAVADLEKPADGHLHIRGEVRNLGPVVPRGFLQVCGPEHPVAIGQGQSGRYELAQWLTRPDHPLTARVMVNRIWHHLLGAGLVPTVDNFGATGEPPSHPALLDYLAVRFVEEAWSVKWLVRQIVLSRVYQLSTGHSTTAAAADPENRLLWRARRKRIDAEALRDAMLAVSGQLDYRAGGDTRGEGQGGQAGKLEYGYRYQTNRRSVYVPIFRNSLMELFALFDFADPNNAAGRRSVSTLPTQALYLMNSPRVMQYAQDAAARLLADDALDEAARLTVAYRRTLGRAPDDEERQAALEYLQQATAAAGKSDSRQQRLEAWTRLVQTLFACVDFRYVN